MRDSCLNFGGSGRCCIPCIVVLAVALGVAGPATSFAQATQPNLADHAFRCSVADSNGRALSGIALELRSAAPPLEQIRSLTDSDGSYTFEGLREGEYILTVAGGILLPPRHVQVNGETTATFSLRLPIAVPAVPGRDAAVISVRQLNVPAKVQEAARKAYDAWIKHNFHQSRTLALRVLQLRPQYGPALTLLGMLDLHEGHPAEAVPELLQAVHEDPSSPSAYLTLASAYNELRQNEEALHALSLMAKLTPEVWQLHYEMGRALVGQSRYDAAMLEFDHAQAVSRPDDTIIHLGKAHALLGLGNFAGAHDELDMVVRNSPDGPFAAESRELALVVDSHLIKAAIPRGTTARDTNPARMEH